MANDNESPLRGILRAVGDGLAEEGRAWLRWARGGAILGGGVLGAVGLYLFGVSGLAAGAAIGLILGGAGGWLFYLVATSH